MRHPVFASKKESGQALLVVIAALGIFILAALGFALDISRWYTEKQVLHSQADAAAQAAMMSVFDGTELTDGFLPPFPVTCGGSSTPCQYATQNGFQTGDTVTVNFPLFGGAPGVPLSPTDLINVTRVTAKRPVPLTFMQYVMGNPRVSPLSVTVQATAAIVQINSTVPLIVTHPTLSGALNVSGPLTVCGGPERGIEVNSSDAAAANVTATINLAQGGPTDTNATCSGNGASLAVWGGPTGAPGPVSLGSGQYVQPASPIRDPLASVAAPALPAAHLPSVTDTPGGANGCPATAPANCTVYYPGLYTGAADSIPAATDTNTIMAFTPGIYYMQGANFGSGTEGMVMAVGQTDPTTGWTGNMLVYMTGTGAPATTGAVNITSNVIAGLTPAVNLVGSPFASPYEGMLFFVDRTAAAQTHTISDAGGGLSLSGAIYMTNYLGVMLIAPAQYQTLQLTGNGAGSSISGLIVASALSVSGTGFTVSRTPGTTGTSTALIPVRQVALVR